MKLLPLLSNRTDRKLEKLGFKKILETKYVTSYERRVINYGYTQCLDICWKKSGNHLIMSYQYGVNADGHNNVVGLNYQETKLIMKKYRELKRKHWRSVK